MERSLTGQGPAYHVVSPGETLYSIALNYEKDYHDLALLNHLDSRYTIYPGQRLRLRGRLPPRAATTSTRAANASRDGGRSSASSPYKTSVTKKPSVTVAPGIPEVRSSSPAGGDMTWAWPASGPVIGNFGGSGVTGKGLDIGGKRGDSVRAAASGVVVYAGSGLVGYGRLLIIRHDDNYISAYAHNDKFLVKEGERVKLGQAIAEMGASGADRDKLHFEIREHGKPVDPLRLLPPRD